VFDSCQEIIRVKLRSNPMIITYPDKDVYCLKVLKHTYFTQSTKFRVSGCFLKLPSSISWENLLVSPIHFYRVLYSRNIFEVRPSNLRGEKI
jgi:hypothetical protein